MPVGEMLQRMDSSEITEWLAYFSVINEPEKKVNSAELLKAQFAHRVKRKK